MKWSFATIGVILLGLMGVSIILLFQTVTTSSESDYYLLKEITEAAMIDAIDISYYRETGDLKIVREKFVENFSRRFAESTPYISGGYTINYYDIIETPPKVSVIIDTEVGEFVAGGNLTDFSVQNRLDAILEYVGERTYDSPGDTYYNNPYTSHTHTEYYYAIPSVSSGNFNTRYSIRVPNSLVSPNIKNVKITNVQIDSEEINTVGKLGVALLNYNTHYNNASISDYRQSLNNYATSVSNFTGGYHNCNLSGGNADYSCTNIHRYYVDLSGTCDPSKYKAIFKYKVTWSYDEYEFS